MARHARSSDYQPTPASAGSSGWCMRCQDGTCRSCAQRRRHAWKLVTVDGLEVEVVAGQMGVTAGRVRVLVAQENERRELQRYRGNQVPVERVRALVELELERNPELTRALLARSLQMSQINVDRQLGYTPGPTGARQRRVSLRVAGKVAIALGHAPYEIDSP